MSKIKFLFPLMFLVAVAGSAFTRHSAQKSKAFGVQAYYVDANNFCQGYWETDPNCSPDLLGPVCEEWTADLGWTVRYEFGTTTICYMPLYSLFPNNP